MTAKKIRITHASSRKAQEDLDKRLNAWLQALLKVDGFWEWKNEHLIHQLNVSMDPTAPVQISADFKFETEIVEEHNIVSGYYGLMSALFAVRETRFYFKKYPFSGQSVSREAHLRTCCEMMFSRVYHFKTRMMNLLKRLDRKTEPKKTLPLEAYKKSFEAHFSSILSERNALTHEAAYSDVQIRALGISDILATADPELAFLKMSSAGYRKIANEWIKKVDHVAEELDLYVGFVALLMVTRCGFLVDPGPEQPQDDA
jgi:hypothetical protein